MWFHISKEWCLNPENLPASQLMSATSDFLLSTAAQFSLVPPLGSGPPETTIKKNYKCRYKSDNNFKPQPVIN